MDTYTLTRYTDGVEFVVAEELSFPDVASSLAQRVQAYAHNPLWSRDLTLEEDADVRKVCNVRFTHADGKVVQYTARRND